MLKNCLLNAFEVGFNRNGVKSVNAVMNSINCTNTQQIFVFRSDWKVCEMNTLIKCIAVNGYIRYFTPRANELNYMDSLLPPQCRVVCECTQSLSRGDTQSAARIHTSAKWFEPRTVHCQPMLSIKFAFGADLVAPNEGRKWGSEGRRGGAKCLTKGDRGCGR